MQYNIVVKHISENKILKVNYAYQEDLKKF